MDYAIAGRQLVPSLEIDGRRFSALIQPIPVGQERIVGRDVLNQHRVLFDGPAGQVVVDP
jgi:hypothetical protein